MRDAIGILVDVAVEKNGLARLEAMPGVRVILVEKPEEKSRPLPPELLHDVQVLFCSRPPQNFPDLRRLEWMQIASAGYEHLRPLDLPSRGIRASNARGCYDVPVAEWNVSMMINLARNLRQMIRNQEAKIFFGDSAAFQREIRGLTVGLWGYGGLGRETARLARLLGMRVHVLARRPVGPAGDVYCVPGTGDPEGVLPHRVYGPAETRTFLSGLDFLIVTLPLAPSTEGLIGENELRALPRTAFVLNPARGRIIRENALLRALREGWIAGAALDTHYYYPLPAGHPLWTFPNVILTPHIAGSSLNQNFLGRIWDIFTQNVERFLNGRPLMNELSPEQLSG
jgi:phosphoglycerate dehydrogenase-like enzyme